MSIKIKSTALLVVDVINSCAHEKCEIKKWNIKFTKIRKMVPKLIEFIDFYKDKGGEVIFVNTVPWTKKYLAKNLIELYKDPNARYYTKDNSGFAEKFYLVKPKKDKIITKNSYDAFTNHNLKKLLKNKKYVIITGIFGDGCVHSTIQGSFSAGYNLIILKDLIETTDVKRRQQMQKHLKNYTWPLMFGKTINSKDFKKYLI